MKTKQFIFIIIFLTTSINLLACSCSSIKIINAFSNLDFIGIVEFESIKRIKNSYGLYESKINIKELYKGNRKMKLFINSQEGSSCGFLPEQKMDYFILGYKNEGGIIETSYCLVNRIPKKEKLLLLRKLSKKKIYEGISLNLRQVLKGKINYNLFEKDITGVFLYKVILNSDLTIKEIIPKNENAKKNYNEKIRKELKEKIFYKNNENRTELKKENSTSFVILNWTKNYENKKIITTTKL